MKYILFSNQISISDGVNTRRVNEGADLKNILGPGETVKLCVVDIDVLITASVESPIEKKDSVLVRKFNELYQDGAYVIQNEKIDNNLFQVIGIKEQKVRQVYSLIPSSHVESFLPYGITLRNTLVNRNVDLNRTVVFVDDQGTERLVTVFDGFKFGRTRAIANIGEDILPEIKRSHIDFFKKNEGHIDRKNADFAIVVNNEALASEINKSSEQFSVECLNVAYPALEGLREVNTPIKYRLPEEILEKRRAIELRKSIAMTMLSLGVIAAGTIFLLFNKIELGASRHQHDLAMRTNEQLNEKLSLLDRQTYRQDLKRHKTSNYAIPYLAVLDLIPSSYKVDSFKFSKSNDWNLEFFLSIDNAETFDPIPRKKILKNAEIKDIFVNNQPGKHLRIIL